MTENPFTNIENQIQEVRALLLQILSSQQEGTSSIQKPLTIKEAAVFLNLSEQTLYTLTSKKKIPHIKRGGRLYFFEEKLLEWLTEGKQETRPSPKSTLASFSRSNRRIRTNKF